MAISNVSKFYTDRIVQYPGRITLTDTTYGNQNTYDVDRAEGTITRDGTPFNADSFNRIADEILDIEQYNADLIADELTQTLTANTSYFTGSIKYDKIGSLVIVYVSVSTTAAISAGTSRGLSSSAIASAYRPATQANGIIRNMTDPLLQVSTSGQVSVYPASEAIPTGTAIKGEVCYFV